MAVTERLAILLETVGTSTVVRDFDKIGGATKGLDTKATAAQGSLKGLAGAGGQLATSLGGVAGVLTASVAGWTAIIGAGAHAVGTFNDLAQQVLAFQRASGATAEQASALVAAFDDMNVSAEAGTKAVFQLGKNVEKLSKFGVEASRDAEGNVDLAATLLDVADAYSQTADPAQRAQLVTAAFGRAGRELIPVLEQGRAGIEALYAGAATTGQILSQEDIDRSEDFRIAMDSLGDSLRSLSIAAGQFLVPILSEAADVLTRLIDVGRDVGNLPVVGDVLRGVAKGAFAWANGANDASTAQRELAEGADRVAQALAEEEKAVDDLGKALFGVTSAQRAYDASVREVDSANRDLADARADYNKLLREGAVDEEKVADARRSLNEATRSLGSAQRALARAQEEYNDAQAAFLALPSDTNADKLSDATDNLADAKDGVASSTEREQEAAADLAKARAGDPDFNDKLTKAKQRLTDAEVDLSDAVYTQGQRAFELNSKLTEQNTLLGENAGAVAALRSEWSALLALRPELEPFLAGVMAALGGASVAQLALPPTATGRETRYGVSPQEALGLTVPTAPAGGGGTALKTVGDIVINITEAVTNPAELARQIIWNLN